MRRRVSARGLFLLVSIAAALPGRAFAALELLASGFDLPVFAASPPGDARIFVLEQAGLIRIVKNGQILPTPFLDLTGAVAFEPGFGDDERGLLGIEFAPDFAASGVFYVFYVSEELYPNPGRVTVARHTVSANPDVAQPNGTVLLAVDKPAPSEVGATESYHNGGQVAFGPDGLLYVGIGDGGGWSGNDPFECAQNPLSPAGKMLRLNLAALQPPAVATTSDSCPFFAVPPAGVEIWASGLRNPWRFSFDTDSGDLYIGDVGQDAVEEIDRVAAASLAGPGPNFGWDVREGNQCNGVDPTPGIPCPNGAFWEPTHTYLPVDGPYCDAAVTGGVVYRGADAALRGQYFFSDFCQGFIHSLEMHASGAVTAVHDRTAAFAPATGSLELIAGIGEDGNGELLFVDYGFGPGSFTGELYGTAPEPGALATGALAVVALFARRRLALR